jgi:hypothetical protein
VSFKLGALTTARTFKRARQHILRDVAAMAAGGTGDLNEHDPALPDRGSSFVNKRHATSPSRLILEINVCELLPFAHDDASGLFLEPGGREAAKGAGW